MFSTVRKATRFPLYVAARIRPNNHQNAMINVAGPKFFWNLWGKPISERKKLLSKNMFLKLAS